RRPVHNARTSNRRAQRHARRDSLRDANDIRIDSGMIRRPPLPCSTHPALHFVGDKQNPVLTANSLQLPQKRSRRGDVSAFALDWFDENRSYVSGIRQPMKNLILQEFQTLFG